MQTTPRLYMSWAETGIDLSRLRTQRGQTRGSCPQCTPLRQPQHQRELDLSVNRDDNTWHCHHCSWAGRIADTQFPVRTSPGAGSTPLSQRTTTHKMPRSLPTTPNATLTYLNDRGISDDTRHHFGLSASLMTPPQADSARLSLHFPYYLDGKHINTKHRTIDDGDRQFWMEAGCEQTFYNLDHIDPDQPLIITEGELDAISVHEAGLSNVISVPGGAPQPGESSTSARYKYFERSMELLSSVPSVVLATDNDGPGLALQAELARRIGPLKCRRVAWPPECKDANDVLVTYGPEGLRSVIENAPIYPVAGLYTGEDLAPDLDHVYDTGWDQGALTGLDALDAICRFVPGYISIVTGHSGSGKSTVLDNILVGLAQTSDWPVTLYSPEQMPLARHQQQLIQIRTRMPMFGENRMPKDVMHLANRWLSDYFSYVNPKDRRDLDAILEHIRMEVMRRGIKAFVIDPWNCIADEKPSHMNGTDWINKALFTIKMFAQETNTHGFIVAHPTKMKPAKLGEPEPRPGLTDIGGSINFRNQADYGLVVHRDQQSVNWKNVVEIGIAKIRMQETGQAGALARFVFNPATARLEQFSGPNPS